MASPDSPDLGRYLMLPMQAPYGHQDQKRQNIGAKSSAIVSKPAETRKPFIVLCESSVFLFQGKRLDGGPEKAQATLQGQRLRFCISGIWLVYLNKM